MAQPALLDLFSGIGGFSLGLGRAGFRTVAFCEIDPWCRQLLAKHWPTVPAYEDVTQLTAARLRADGIDQIDAICGGFPCQDISLAGTGAGLDGSRSGLWHQFHRLIGELRPRVAIVENVGALRGRGLLEILGHLASIGYDAEWHAIPAGAVGAPHLRDRVWIVAVDANRDDGRPWRPGRSDPASAGQPEPERTLQACIAPDPTVGGPPELRGLFGPLARSLAAAATPWPRTAEPPLRGMDDGLSAGLDGPGRARRKLVRTQDRNRMKALGNAVVPAIPEIIGRAIIDTYFTPLHPAAPTPEEHHASLRSL